MSHTKTVLPNPVLSSPIVNTPKTFLQGLVAVIFAILVSFQILTVAAHAQTKHFYAHDKANLASIDHSAWNALLGSYVKTLPSGLNAVYYKKLKAESSSKLTGYLNKMQAVKISGYNRDEQFAYWANLYNAKTLDIIIQHYPVATIRDIDISGLFSNGPWGKKVLKVEGQSLSLNDIEHKILRPIWKDPRVHYAVNCASIGCPNLGKTAFSGKNISAQLDQAASDYINSPRGVKVSANSRVTASKIFNWYGKDFGGNDTSLLAHFRKYADDSLKQKLKNSRSISSYTYNWNLNEIK